MRWIHKPYPKGGDSRERAAFLIFPKRIDMETRWLEVAHWRELYDLGPPMLGGLEGWHPVEWLNE